MLKRSLKLRLSIIFLIHIVSILNITVGISLYETDPFPEGVEIGDAIIKDIFCSDDGQLFIFYYREWMLSDYGEWSDTLLKVIQIDPNKQFNNITDTLAAPFFPWGLAQEDGDSLRLIGWKGGNLSEIDYKKQTKNLSIKSCGVFFNYSGHNEVLFPTQRRIENKITNYTLIGWSEREGVNISPVIVTTNGSIASFTYGRKTDLTSYSIFMADNSSIGYYVTPYPEHVINPDYFKIKTLWPNGTEINSTLVKPKDYDIPYALHMDLYFRNDFSGIGRDGNPYYGLFNNSFESDNSGDQIELINLRSAKSIQLSIPISKANYTKKSWISAIDHLSRIHVFSQTYKQDPNSRWTLDGDDLYYLQYYSNGTLKFNVKVPKSFESVRIGGGTLYGEKYIVILSKKGDKLLIIDTEDGLVVKEGNTGIDYIDYSRGITWDIIWNIPAILLVTRISLYLKLNKKEKKKIG